MYFSRDFTRSKRHRTCEGEVFRGWRGIQNEPRDALLDLVISLSGWHVQLHHQVLIWGHSNEVASNQGSAKASKRKDGGCDPVGSRELVVWDIPGSRPLRAAIRRRSPCSQSWSPDSKWVENWLRRLDW